MQITAAKQNQNAKPTSFFAERLSNEQKYVAAEIFSCTRFKMKAANVTANFQKPNFFGKFLKVVFDQKVASETYKFEK